MKLIFWIFVAILATFSLGCSGGDSKTSNLVTSVPYPTSTPTPIPSEECLIPDPRVDRLVNGKKLVVDQGRIYLQDVVTSEASVLTDPGFMRTDSNPVWLPSEVGIVFVRGNGLYAQRFGSQAQEIVTGFAGKIADPIGFSPDGSKLVFAARKTENNRQPSTGVIFDIYVVGFDGTGLTYLTSETKEVHYYTKFDLVAISWKDNQTVCYETKFEATQGAGYRENLKFQIKVDGSGKQQVR